MGKGPGQQPGAQSRTREEGTQGREPTSGCSAGKRAQGHTTCPKLVCKRTTNGSRGASARCLTPIIVGSRQKLWGQKTELRARLGRFLAGFGKTKPPGAAGQPHCRPHWKTHRQVRPSTHRSATRVRHGPRPVSHMQNLWQKQERAPA